jgi:chloramphenicol-sensitive protein RarD
VSGAGPPGRDPPAGILLAAAAYALWGLFPLYFKAVAAVPALQVLAHRVLWALVAVALVLLVVPAARAAAAAAFARPRLLAALLASASLLSLNWGVFIHAVATGRVLDASLGYFINPLVSVLLGVAVLGERLGRRQWLAVGLALAAVLIDIAWLGRLPWIALVLAVSFAGYGLIRKLAPIDALAGLFMETALLAPVALVYLVVLTAAGRSAFAAGDLASDLLLVLAGPVTALPLVLFVAGARRVRLATAGLLQYIAPTGHFLLAVFAFGEAMSAAHWLTFALIWLALGLYGAEAVQRPGRRAVRQQR